VNWPYIKSVALRPELLHALLLTDLSLSLDAGLPGEQPVTGHKRSGQFVCGVNRVGPCLRQVLGIHEALYSHLIDAKRTATRPGVKIRNVWPFFRQQLVRAVRRGAKIQEKIVAANLTDSEAYRIEGQMIGKFHKQHSGQLSQPRVRSGGCREP